MALSTAYKDAMEIRRERVARLRLRGMTEREITDVLANGDKDGQGRLHNPETNKPYSNITIHNDLQALKAQWRESSNAATDEHISRQYAEIQELKRLAWAQKDGDLALKSLSLEMKLLGTMKQPDGITINVQLVNQLFQMIERRGDSAEEWVVAMIREYELAEHT